MRRQTNNYHFSVEGETEIYYLNHLSMLINSDDNRECNVKFRIRKTNPKSFVKGTPTLGQVNFYHVTDVESLDEYHINDFKRQLSEMKDAKTEISAKVKEYYLGYTNFTFELWMILHKKDCNRRFNHRSNYLTEINSAFNKAYDSLDDFKKEREFKSILNEITLEDVKEAIRRSNTIIRNLEQDGYRKMEYKGYEYYHENPSLSLHEVVSKILKESGLI